MDDLDLTDIVPETQPTSFQLDGDIENIRSQSKIPYLSSVFVLTPFT